MIAVDTNILVYAHRRDSPFHAPAKLHVKQAAEDGSAWAIPWPCIHEFLAIVTHPRIYRPPSTTAQALDQVDAWIESPGLQWIGEISGYWENIKTSILKGGISGPLIHDARVAAICRQHGIAAFWSADRDFSRFAGLKIVNPAHVGVNPGLDGVTASLRFSGHRFAVCGDAPKCKKATPLFRRSADSRRFYMRRERRREAAGTTSTTKIHKRPCRSA